MNTTKQALLQANIERNTYFGKYETCKQVWKRGTIIGGLIALGLSLLLCEFEINEMFFGLLPFFAISAISVMAAFFALRSDETFPLTGFARKSKLFGGDDDDYDDYEYDRESILSNILLVLRVFRIFILIMGTVFFSMVFPVMSLRYVMGYRSQEKKIAQSLQTGNLYPSV